MLCFHRSAFVLIWQETAFKMHRRINSIDLICQLLRHKINDPYIFRIFQTLKHDRINGLIHIAVKLVKVFPGNTAKTELDKLESQDLLYTVI